MPFTRSILVSAFLATLLIGCKKAETPPAPTTTSGSVAAPEASLPPSDAAVPSTTGTSSSGGNASGPAQTDPKELTNKQESTDMPLSGQANNHSTPEPVEKK